MDLSLQHLFYYQPSYLKSSNLLRLLVNFVVPLKPASWKKAFSEVLMSFHFSNANNFFLLLIDIFLSLLVFIFSVPTALVLDFYRRMETERNDEDTPFMDLSIILFLIFIFLVDARMFFSIYTSLFMYRNKSCCKITFFFLCNCSVF